jgi:hypothetical protein
MEVQMSWDLAFWKPERPGTEVAMETYTRLAEEEEPDGLAWLSAEDVKAQFRAQFPETTDDGTELNWEGSGSYFQVNWPVGSRPRHTLAVFVSCGWSLLERPEVIDRIRTVGGKLGCGVFDPQSEEWSTNEQ